MATPLTLRHCWSRANARHRLIVCSITILLVLISSLGSIALAQLPSLTTPGGTQPLPVGVQRRGTLEATGVRLDGRELFRIASPAVLNREQPGDQIPVEVRAKQVEANLAQVVADGAGEPETRWEPDSFTVLTRTINGQPVLFARDDALPEPKVLLTVTDADAQYAATSRDRLAAQWQKILQRELREALELRQPEALQQQVSTVIKVLVAALLLTLLLGAAWSFMGRRKKQLQQRQAAEPAIVPPPERTLAEPPDTQLEPRFQDLQRHFSLQQRLQIVRFLRWLLFWAIAFVWVAGISYSLSTFPQTRQFARKIVIIPIVLLITWFVIGLINRLTDLATDSFIQNRAQDQSLTPANLQRITTIAKVLKGLKLVLIYAIGILWVLQRLDLVAGSVLALGTVLALVLSFAAQSLVKDLVNGFLILLEDQFRIGDNIRLGDISGNVENLNLRITQLRSDDGSLITIPNSLITQVENRSRTWARADFQIEVAYDTDVDRALAVVRETVDQMAQDPAWRSVILDTHELFGVDQISHAGIVIRIWIKTTPLGQWNTARELRRRLKIAFDRHQIQIGTPRQIWLENGSGQLVKSDLEMY